MRTKTTDVAGQLAELEERGTPALRARWETLFDKPPPKGLSRRLLRYAIAHDIQANAYGGLKPATIRKLSRLAEGATGSVEKERSPVRRRSLSPGARLVREWQGRVHTVDVTESGFLYAGTRYRSLSEVARTITGVRWSGPRFFGL